MIIFQSTSYFCRGFKNLLARCATCIIHAAWVWCRCFIVLFFHHYFLIMARITSFGFFSITQAALAAAELNSRGVLTNAELKDVLCERDARERSTVLVNAIDRSLSRDSTGASEVIDTFEVIKKYSDIVEEAGVCVETCQQAQMEPNHDQLPEAELYKQQGKFTSFVVTCY